MEAQVTPTYELYEDDEMNEEERRLTISQWINHLCSCDATNIGWFRQCNINSQRESHILRMDLWPHAINATVKRRKRND